MAIFGPKLWVFWKNVNFSTFWTSCFYCLERRFFVLEYRKRLFPGLYCLKKKFIKWPFLGLVGQGNVFYSRGKCVFDILEPGKAFLGYKPLQKNANFSTFWTFCFYSIKRSFFFLEYRKRYFPGLQFLKE